jgi:hypothetical protein
MTATTPLTCDGFANALADYLERDDSPRFRAAVEAHAASCPECGALLADVQQLQVDAAGLPTLTPSRDLWDGIAARIEAPVIELGRRAEGPGPRDVRTRRVATWLRPMAAAAALVAITAGVTYFATRQMLQPGQQVAARPVESTRLDPRTEAARAFDSASSAVASEREDRSTRLAPRTQDLGPRTSTSQPPTLIVPVAESLEPVYDREIARLRRIIDQRRALLDTATIGVIERNLTIIDRAIHESRAALARDPASALLNEQLNDALQQKVELLRAAALLPVRS